MPKMVRKVAPAAGLLLLAGLHLEPLQAGETDVRERTRSAASVPAASEAGGCVESETVLCLHEGRYEVTAEFTVNSETMAARVARPRTRDSGLFYFFERNNWEMLLKVLDGCGENQHHWVFAATASDVGIRLVVRDTTLPAQNADGGMIVNSRTYDFPPIVRRPQGPDESDEDYQRNVLAKGHPALTEVGAFPDACPASS
ncbi:MAG: hypothetical protein F4X59_07635 [Holophagales bacterium]|nr:hypothetical protein [Holophagales bacterium]MXX61305.1 hypothetical protein [Holophagales bacterium]MYC09992.1 hypothetical protein [Holophagales bacterium]MYD24155.1 hypothetical protein [Holophagales bacterium]MYI34687.1 hypothetical protein [Holophagales bacterium]